MPTSGTTTTSSNNPDQTTPEQKRKEQAKDLQAVTVTVELREQSLQKYAGTAQAFSSDDLRGQSINSVKELQVAVPGLSVANQEGNTEIYIRGVGSANSTELGDPAVAPHLDGVYIPRPRGPALTFYDLERAEVNKGLQGTLRGRNALGYTPDDSIWRFEAFASNVFNKQVTQKALVGSGINVRFLNDARSFGLRARAEF